VHTGRVAADFGIYIHVPFCASRCGYCDFNTYTSTELGGGGAQAEFADTVAGEIRFARASFGDDAPIAQTVFFGGGTPTLLPAADLVRILDLVRETFGLTPDAEVTTEANPESVDAQSLQTLRNGGFNRISFGMQSARAHVLAVLDRQHTPGRTADVVALARAAGFEHVNVDLIYGTPGESDGDWRASLDEAIATGVDHVSAYSLIVEDGTRLAARIGRGELAQPDDDVAADRYLIADERLSAAEFTWYEVSNWARDDDARSRHNLLYWTNADWWGFGPGAHSHLDGVRWWNVKHPTTYAARLAAGESPAQGRETLTTAERRMESVMLALRLRDGLPLERLSSAGRREAERLRADGLVEQHGDAIVLTVSGRLLANTVIARLVD
jgi:putative oxygen-independent coproporphyrinogen III oxidase